MIRKISASILILSMFFCLLSYAGNAYASPEAATLSAKTALSEMELTDEEKANVYMSLGAILLAVFVVLGVAILFSINKNGYLRKKKGTSYTIIARPGPDAINTHYENEEDKNKYDYI